MYFSSPLEQSQPLVYTETYNINMYFFVIIETNLMIIYIMISKNFKTAFKTENGTQQPFEFVLLLLWSMGIKDF